MKTSLLTKCEIFSLLATVLLLPACQGGPKPGEPRWGMVVIFEKDGVCKHLSGPQRIGAYPKDEIVWRIYNKCITKNGLTAHTFAISDIRHVPDGSKAPSQATSPDEAARLQSERKNHTEVNPFEGELSIPVPATGTVVPFKLRVKADAPYGLYTFVTLLDGKANEDDEADIWPPR
jgi:hypothetical protein